MTIDELAQRMRESMDKSMVDLVKQKHEHPLQCLPAWLG